MLTNFEGMRARFPKKCPSKSPPLQQGNNKNDCIVLFHSLNEASWFTDYNAKIKNSFRWTVLEKINLAVKGVTFLKNLFSDIPDCC